MELYPLPKLTCKSTFYFFSNPYNAHEFLDNVKNINCHQLPDSFHQYLKEDVQPLDRL